MMLESQEVHLSERYKVDHFCGWQVMLPTDRSSCLCET